MPCSSGCRCRSWPSGPPGRVVAVGGDGVGASLEVRAAVVGAEGQLVLAVEQLEGTGQLAFADQLVFAAGGGNKRSR